MWDTNRVLSTVPYSPAAAPFAVKIHYWGAFWVETANLSKSLGGGHCSRFIRTAPCGLEIPLL